MCDAENLEFSRCSIDVSIKNQISYRRSFGDFSGGDTPGPIPNPVVKSASADGTWGATPWESRSLPRDFLRL